MKRILDWKLNHIASGLVALVIVLVPFHAFLTVWLSSIFGHYTLLRLWDEVALLGLMAVVGYWLSTEVELRKWFLGSLLVRLILGYAGLTILLGFIAFLKSEVTGKALAYGLLLDLRYFAWFLAVLITSLRSSFLKRKWSRLLLAPAGVVVVFGLLQLTVLPHTFLSHFGYNAATTIAPIETINHNSAYVRVQSTLRGANPLGAYLVIILSALAVFCIKRQRLLAVALFSLAGLIVLYGTGSRSAWLGAAVAVFGIALHSMTSKRNRLLTAGIGVILVIAIGTLYIALKNNVQVQNEVLHTQSHSKVATTSNGAHLGALKAGLRDMIHQPLGDGAGTAGPASVYNGAHPARIAEDYYIQIGQESGWLGLVLFLAILYFVGRELYDRMSESRLAVALLASFVGIGLVNLLSHAWADDTLAYIWWGLAGIALAVPRKQLVKHEV